MGHKVGGKVERAYSRTTLLDIRRKLMDAWGAYFGPSSADGKGRGFARPVRLHGTRGSGTIFSASVR
jgi:hypothetical protein